MSGFFSGGLSALQLALREERDAKLARLRSRMKSCSDAESKRACQAEIRRVRTQYNQRIKTAHRSLY